MLFLITVSCNDIKRNNEGTQTFIDDGKLTRERAKDILLKSQSIPEYLVRYFCLTDEPYLIETYQNDYVLKNFFKDCVDRGLFEDCTPDRWYGRENKFSEEGKKYIVRDRVNEPRGNHFLNDYRYLDGYDGFANYCWGGGTQLVGVKVATVHFGEITGIRERDQKNATVEYTVFLSDITPFGELLNIKKMLGQGKMEASFHKYDDGWRFVMTEPKIR